MDEPRQTNTKVIYKNRIRGASGKHVKLENEFLMCSYYKSKKKKQKPRSPAMELYSPGGRRLMQ